MRASIRLWCSIMSSSSLAVAGLRCCRLETMGTAYRTGVKLPESRRPLQLVRRPPRFGDEGVGNNRLLATARQRFSGMRDASGPSSAAGDQRERESAGGAAASSLHLFYNDVYKVDLPKNHRFPMEKYRVVREVDPKALLRDTVPGHDFSGRVGHVVHQSRLQRELSREVGQGPRATFAVSPLACLEDLCTTHDRDYVERYFHGRFTQKENRTVGFPWSEDSVRRSVSSVGGTIGATHEVCGSGETRTNTVARGNGEKKEQWRRLFAGHIAGGTHHAFRDRGEGFCVFSDIAVAANVALRDYPDTIRQILIIDCDVHQGNGNAALFADNPSVFTFSLHCRANYFSEKVESDLDVEVEDGAGDREYLNHLSEHIPTLVDKVRPDLIFYQGGVDPLLHDRLGRLRLTREGLRHRNRLVYQTAIERSIPTVVTMGGGYPKDLDPTSEWFGHIVRSHQDVYTDAAHMLYSYFGLAETSDTDQGFAGSSFPPSEDVGAVAGRW